MVRPEWPLDPPPPAAAPLNVTTTPVSTVSVYVPGAANGSVGDVARFCEPRVGPSHVIVCAAAFAPPTSAATRTQIETPLRHRRMGGQLLVKREMRSCRASATP